MNYKQAGFRSLYKHFAAFMLRDDLRPVIEGCPGADKADCVLTYGYIDHDAGLTMEVLAVGKRTDDSFSFFEPCMDNRAMLRIGSVADDQFFVLDDSDGGLSERYAEKISVVEYYAASEQIEQSRKFAFLDRSRHEHFPDDVLVYLTKRGLDPEGCWVRIIGLGDGCIMGRLLNEPDQEFGCHEGDELAFFVQETQEHGVICCADMTPSRKLTAEDLEDGELLKSAVSAFNANRTKEHLIDLLEILRDSYVWVPCNAVMSDEDMAQIEKAVKEAGDELSELVGKTFSNKEHIRLIPDILQNGEQFFFPVFSSQEEMGEYGTHFSQVQKHVLEVIPMARSNEKNVAGIVFNAFTEPFVLDAELFDVVENMKSRLE